MARYRAKALLFTDRLIEVGEEFESDLQPGRNWEPLDAEAKAKAEKLPPAAADPMALVRARPLLEIPEDWRNLNPQQIINLAVKLGAPHRGTTKDKAIAAIEAELFNRARDVKVAA